MAFCSSLRWQWFAHLSFNLPILLKLVNIDSVLTLTHTHTPPVRCNASLRLMVFLDSGESGNQLKPPCVVWPWLVLLLSCADKRASYPGIHLLHILTKGGITHAQVWGKEEQACSNCAMQMLYGIIQVIVLELSGKSFFTEVRSMNGTLGYEVKHELALVCYGFTCN